jgi:tetratricopeptide (TPR) repeat protein
VSGPEHIGFWFWTSYAVLIPILATFTLPNGKIVGPAFLLMEAGLAFYLYMPIASAHHPPMNWGYTGTWEGFIAAITRGQYARVTLTNIFSLQFLKQAGMYLMDLRSQFYWPIAGLAAGPLFFARKLGKHNIAWLATTLIAFLSTGIVFMILQNPETDINSLFIGRVQYIQSHAVYVLWIGYGIVLLMARLATLAHNNPIARTAGVALVLLLPSALLYKNYNDESQLMVVGGAEQNGHDFGWQFGHGQLQGVDGIKADLKESLSPREFEAVWADYPNPDYPPPMDTNAVFFGGSDPGRFIPTYMIYSAKVRPDIYLITQNALANRTYTNEIRDLYGEQLWTPGEQDRILAFNQFEQAVRSGKIKAGPEIRSENGRLVIQGAEQVMKINGSLTRMIFNHNQFITECKTNEATRPPGSAVVFNDALIDPQTGRPRERAFYLEESTPIPWMYPYLTPHGLIMKINNRPTPLTEEHIKNDTEFWGWYSKRLLANEKFLRDTAARRAFSKLRTALATLFAAKNRPGEAEAAYRQALLLYDLNLDANFRLAFLLADQHRFSEAADLLGILARKDPNNRHIEPRIQYIESRQKLVERKDLLEKEKAGGRMDFDRAMELAAIYVQTGAPKKADQIGMALLNSKAVSPSILLQLARHMAGLQRHAVAEQALINYTSVAPKDPRGWLNLAAFRIARHNYEETPDLLEKAIAIGGEPIRNILRKDPRFDPVRNSKEFKKLVPLRVTNALGSILFPGI